MSGPITRNFAPDNWGETKEDEIYRRKARQGQGFLTSDEVLVTKLPEEGASNTDQLVEVPWDGKTVGEIVCRGNIIMKVFASLHFETSRN